MSWYCFGGVTGAAAAAIAANVRAARIIIKKQVMNLMQMQESGENYLETILMEQRKNGLVRSIDLANALGFSKPTISITMKRFRENGYIETDENGFILLTEKGRTIAEKMYERHEVLANLLIQLGVNEQTAYQDACKIEHHISEETFDCVKRHLQSLRG